MNFDDQPAVASSGTFSSSNPPPELLEEAPADDFSEFSPEELLHHSNWKARKFAYEQAAQVPEDCKELILNNLPHIMKEGNAAAFDMLLELLTVVLEVAEEGEVAEIFAVGGKAIIDRGLCGSRPRGSKTAAALLSTFTLGGEGPLVGEALLATFGHKTPKARLAAVQSMTNLVSEFGAQCFPIDQLMRAMPPIFNDLDGKVRNAAKELACQLYRYAGSRIEVLLGTLRDVQRQELEAAFKNVSTGAVPTKVARGAPPPSARSSVRQSSAMPPAASAGRAMDDGLDGQAETPVISRLPKSFFASATDKDSKWQERVNVITDQLLPLVNKPRLKASEDYTDLCKLLRTLLMDPQGPIMTAAFKAVQSLTQGLRANIGPYCKFLIPPVFDKLKDKKTASLEAVYKTLEGFLLVRAVPFEAMMDDFETAATSKIPHLRVNALQWALRTSKVLDAASLMCLNRPAFFKQLAADEKADVRDATVALLAQVVDVCGEGAFKSVIGALDDKTVQKLRGGGASTSGPPSLNASVSNLQASTSGPPSRKGSMSSMQRPGSSGAPRALSSNNLKAAAAAPGSNSSTPTSVGASKAAAPISTEELESGMPSLDEAIATLGEDCAAAVEQLAAKEWKTRAEGATVLADVMQSWEPERVSSSLDSLIVIVKARPGWKEAIFQVVNAIINLFTAALLPPDVLVSQRGAYAIASGLLPKIGEGKSKAIMKNLLSLLCEHTGPRFVTRHVMAAAANLKKPTVTVETLDWLQQTVYEFPSAPLDAKGMVEFITGYCLEQPQPPLRAGAVKLYVALHLRVGAKLSTFIANVNPHVKNTIEQEVENCQGPPADIQPRTVRASAKTTPGASAATTPAAAANSTKAAAAAAAAAAQPAGDGMDDNIPAVDLGPRFAAAQRRMQAADWKERLAAVKEVAAMVNEAHRSVAPNGVSEVIRAMARLFREPNKNFVIDVLRTQILVAEAAGPQGARNGLKMIMPEVIALLGDQKPQLRDEAVTLANIGFTFLPVEHILPLLPKALATDALFARQAVVNLVQPLMEQSTTANLPARHIQPLLGPLCKLCMDRNGDVRVKAEQILTHCAPHVGVDAIHRAVMDFKPAEQSQLQGMLSKLQDPPRQTQVQSGVGRVAPRQSTAHVDPNESLGGEGASGPATPEPQGHRPPRMSRAAPPRPAPYSPDEIASEFLTASVPDAIRMCVDLRDRLDGGLLEGLSPSVIVSLTRRLQILFMDDRSFDLELASHSLGCLNMMFRIAELAQKCNITELTDISGIVFDSFMADVAPDDKAVVKGLNELMRSIVEVSDPDTVFSALMSLLSTYSSKYLHEPTRVNHKYVEITVKCLFKIRSDDLSEEAIIMTAHENLVAHPPSAFKDRDDLTIRAIKTILQEAARRYRESILMRCIELVGKQCLAFNFLYVCYQRVVPPEEQKFGHGNSPSASGHPSPQATGALGRVDHNVSSAPSSDCDGEDSRMGCIFSKMRKHVTAQEGFTELYDVLKCEGPRAFDEFNMHYNRCSDAFRVYITRKFQREMDANGESFSLPSTMST